MDFLKFDNSVSFNAKFFLPYLQRRIFHKSFFKVNGFIYLFEWNKLNLIKKKAYHKVFIHYWINHRIYQWVRHGNKMAYIKCCAKICRIIVNWSHVISIKCVWYVKLKYVYRQPSQYKGKNDCVKYSNGLFYSKYNTCVSLDEFRIKIFFFLPFLTFFLPKE